MSRHYFSRLCLGVRCGFRLWVRRRLGFGLDRWGGLDRLRSLVIHGVFFWVFRGWRWRRGVNLGLDQVPHAPETLPGEPTPTELDDDVQFGALLDLSKRRGLEVAAEHPRVGNPVDLENVLDRGRGVRAGDRRLGERLAEPRVGVFLRSPEGYLINVGDFFLRSPDRVSLRGPRSPSRSHSTSP